MNKLSYATAVVYAASLARAQTCQSQLPVPDANAQQDQVQLGRLYFAYMDQCSTDQKVSWKEFQTFVGDTRLAGYSPEQNLRIFQMMDLNNDHHISENELLRYDQTRNHDPLDIEDNLPPFRQISDKVFDYLRCHYDATAAGGRVCNSGYRREDLKAVLPSLLNLNNILDDHVSYEAHVSHEFTLRDIDGNGIVEKWEQGKYDWHYEFMRGFWNNSKGEGNIRSTIIDDGIMTYEVWMEDNNMMLTRDFPNGIPQEAAHNRFLYFDRNRDNELSWWEYWSTIQEDDVQFYHWIKEFEAMDFQPRDDKIMKPELKAYYSNEDPTLTDAELDSKVQDFFNKYNQYEAWRPALADDNVGKWEMWGKVHWLSHLDQEKVRDKEQESLEFEEKVWFASDADRDLVWTHQELIDQMGLDQANEIYVILGKDITDVITKQEASDNLAGEAMKMKEKAFKNAWFVLNYRKDDDTNQKRAIIPENIEISDPEIYATLGIETYEELVELFAQIDTDGSGELSQDEVCRHYMGDFDFYCDEDGDGQDQGIIDPDYKPLTEFEQFWSNIDLDGDDIVQLQAWIDSVAEHELFGDKTEQQLIDIYNQYDMNADGDLSVNEAETAYIHAVTVEDVMVEVAGMWETVDEDVDGNLNSAEFQQMYNVLHNLELIPDTEDSVVDELYSSLLDQHNSNSTTEPVDSLPLDDVLEMMKQATLLAWNDLIGQQN